MSPVAAQGLNIALRDSIVCANHLVPALGRELVDTAAVDTALRQIEEERTPEIQQIQAMQARPPKLMMNHAWWAELLRYMVAFIFSKRLTWPLLVRQLSPFLNGVTEVRLDR